MAKEEIEYTERYGSLPDDTESLVALLESTKKLNWEKIREMEEHIDQLQWETIEFILPLVPKATPRPRYSPLTNTVYVKGAKKNKKIVAKYISDFGIICTRVEYELEVYLKTPSSMSLSEIYLAEKKKILPISKPDFDNVAKTYTDVLQDLLIINDNIINPGSVKKYYSIKPRVKIIIRYQTDFDCEYNRRRVLGTKAYQSLIDKEMNIL